MNNSNWTGRMSRTSREAFGHTIELDKPHLGDSLVGLFAAFVVGFLTAMAVFGW